MTPPRSLRSLPPEGAQASLGAARREAWAPNLRKRPHLARELALALIVKFVALAVIWNLWFAHPASKRLDAPSIGAAIYSSEAASADGGHAHARP